MLKLKVKTLLDWKNITVPYLKIKRELFGVQGKINGQVILIKRIQNFA